jgi:hypothetical protein
LRSRCLWTGAIVFLLLRSRCRFATLRRAIPDGVMDEEYLFWDNQEFMKEIGLGK